MNRRTLLAAMALGAGGGLGLAAHPQLRRASTRPLPEEAAFPDQFGNWRAIDPDRIVLPPEDLLSATTYQRLIVRGYANGEGPPVMLVVAFGARQTYAMQLHRPEICYPASGFGLSERSEADLAWRNHMLSIGWLTAMRGSRVERVLYWTRIGSDYATSLWEQRELIVRNALCGATVDGALVRLSMAGAGERENARLAGFAGALLDQLPVATRALLLAGPG